MASKSKPLTNWLDLPPDLMINILCRVGVIDIIVNAQKVCSTWHNLCKDPFMWRVISLKGFFCVNKKIPFKEICKLAVDRSQGQLVDLTVDFYADDELLRYVADKSSQLRCLRIAYCSDIMLGSWKEALKKFPLLEELNLYRTEISKEDIETAGRCCPMLKTLKVNQRACRPRVGELVEESTMIGNEFARAIGENLSDLTHLELVGCRMSSVGLQVILDGCCHLESLDLRNCWHIHLNEDLLKRCSEQIKHLRLPFDSHEGYPYIYEYSGMIEYAYCNIKPSLVLDGYDDFEDYI